MKRSEEIAKKWFEDPHVCGVSVGQKSLAEFLARETGCDKGCAEPEPDWQEMFHLPLKLKYDGTNGACVASDNGMELSEYSGNSNQRIMAYAHMVDCVNRDAERPEVGAVDWGEVGLPWKVEYKPSGVCISDCDGHKLMWQVRTAPWETAYEEIVRHVNNLPWRDGCPNATDGV